MNFDETPEFMKDFKQLNKKYKSLPDDLKNFKVNFESLVRDMHWSDSRRFLILKRHSLKAERGELLILKVRFSCKSLKNNHKLRLIYSYFEEEHKVEFIEIYFKGSQSNHNTKRVNDYLKDY